MSYRPGRGVACAFGESLTRSAVLTVIDVMASALLLACPQGYLRVFADEGAQVGVLLGRLVAAQRDEAPPRDQAWWSR